jgi:hypothetical protein
VPVAAVADTVATSAASFRTMAVADDEPEKVLVAVNVCAVLRLATLVRVLSAKVMVLFVRVSTPVKVAKPDAVNAA